ncbi:hypothetical protein [Sphingomonas sp. SRS2]|uniref:hypothetical protein n=1 Tax=Sphingomonas sp. SRS2 TaxID=133190 RepID=UPI00128C7867|nr:hypothetical protein [Sphingomonas sp. SRS2]
MLNKMAERGIITKARRGRENCWSSGDSNLKTSDFTWGKNLFEMSAADKRRAPRIGKRPVDLDDTLFGIFADAGKPLTMEEVYTAWGKLRSKRKTGSLAGDMTAIIEAERRRQRRSAKLAPTPKETPHG